MRNLKRVLSLAMASVMLLGMMVIGAGAADYKDSKDVSYDEAVAVMSGIGVFQGDNNGNFNPQGNLTREQAAKIITYMLMGKTAADGLATSKAPFTDVAATRWSAGSIAYCVQNGIVAGDGQGHFMPEAVVTGAQFGKMLLTALGYQAEAEGLVGSGWEVNVAKLVRSADLNKGLSVVLSRNLTREQAAQMAFNALSARVVEYYGGTTVTTTDGTVVVVGGTRTITTDTFAKVYFNAANTMGLKSTNSTTDFGRPAKTWKYNNKTIGTYATTPDFVYTAKTSETAVKADLSDYLPVSALTPENNSLATLGNVTNVKSISDMTANGRVVEVYTTEDEVTAVVVIDTYFGEITSINTASKIAYVSYVNTLGNKVAVTVKSSDNKALYETLAGLGKDAKVLVNLSNAGKVLAVAEPETATGSYTGKGSDGVRTIGGVKYTDSVTATSALNTALTKLGSNYNLYLDAYGYLISAEAESATASTYGFVSGYDVVGSASSTMGLKLRLLQADGTRSWVDVSSYKAINGTTKTVSSQDYNDLLDFGNVTVKNEFVAFSLKSDGTYYVEEIANGSALPAAVGTSHAVTGYSFAGVTITKGAVQIFGNTYDVQASSKTVFLVKNGSAYTVYTGVKNVPTLNTATGYVLAPKDSNVASMVIVESKTSAVDASSLVYIADTTYFDTSYDSASSTSLYIYDAAIKGAAASLTTTTNKDASGNALAPGMYLVEYNSSNYGVTLTKLTSASATVQGQVKLGGNSATISNGVVTINGTNAGSYVTADDFKVVLVDSSDSYAVSEMPAGNLGYYTVANSYVIIGSDTFAASMIVVAAPNT